MFKKECFHVDLEKVIVKKYKNIAGIVVVKDGNLVYENYFIGYKRENTVHVASVTKSVLSSLIGIAIDKGFIESVNQKVLDFMTNNELKAIEFLNKSTKARAIKVQASAY